MGNVHLCRPLDNPDDSPVGWLGIPRLPLLIKGQLHPRRTLPSRLPGDEASRSLQHNSAHLPCGPPPLTPTSLKKWGDPRGDTKKLLNLTFLTAPLSIMHLSSHSLSLRRPWVPSFSLPRPSVLSDHLLWPSSSLPVVWILCKVFIWVRCLRGFTLFEYFGERLGFVRGIFHCAKLFSTPFHLSFGQSRETYFSSSKDCKLDKSEMKPQYFPLCGGGLPGRGSGLRFK